MKLKGNLTGLVGWRGMAGSIELFQAPRSQARSKSNSEPLGFRVRQLMRC